MIIPIAVTLSLALVAVVIVERTCASARLNALEREHQKELRRVSQSNFEEGYIKATRFFITPRRQRLHFNKITSHEIN